MCKAMPKADWSRSRRKGVRLRKTGSRWLATASSCSSWPQKFGRPSVISGKVSRVIINPSGWHTLNSADADDVQWTNHNGVHSIRQSDNHLLADDGCVFRMLDSKNLPAAAMYLKRVKRRILEKTLDMLK